jgi:hypothetical protein
LIFFPPKEITAKPGHPPVTNLAARPNLRMPTPLAAVERVPVRLPGTPARRPHPYLIFQPKPVRDRPSSSPKAKGTSSSAMPPALNVVVAVHTPPVGLETKPVAMPINPPQVPALGREPSIDPADLPPRPVVPAPPLVQKTVRATMLPPVRLNRTPGRIARDPSVGIVGNRQPLRKP